jgi:hypothetical protein
MKTNENYLRFSDYMRQYSGPELQSIVDNGASDMLPILTDTEDVYAQYEGELWGILSEEAEAKGKPVLVLLSDEDFMQSINDGDTLRQHVVWHCMEKVSGELLLEPEEEDEV